MLSVMVTERGRAELGSKAPNLRHFTAAFPRQEADTQISTGSGIKLPFKRISRNGGL